MRAVVVLAVIAAALAAFIVFVDRRHPAGDDQRAAHVRLLPAFDRAAVRRLTIARAVSAPFTLDRQARGAEPAWRISPGPKAADDAAVDDLLGALELAEADRSATIDPRSAGLAPPAVRITVEGAAAALVLALG